MLEDLVSSSRRAEQSGEHNMNMNTQKTPTCEDAPTCPACGELAPLALITASSGATWINCACAPCGMAMSENNHWTSYLGGVTKNK
jgi:hypothetical protein